jgi:aspartyl-tRNA(Asn)/glutamyl-tRNA(Gln) amidotransferase subunit B
VRRTGAPIASLPITPPRLAELCDLVRSGAISGPIAKELFAAMLTDGRPAADIVRERGLERLADTDALEAHCRAALAKAPKQVEQYRAGKTKVFGFFVGEVMKATKGQADPAAVNEILRRLLASA